MSLEIKINYEDEALLAIEKPAGLHSAPKDTADTSPTALQQALDYCPLLAEVNGFHPWEPALLHRLDGGTSGLLLFAKSNLAFTKLRQQFSNLGTAKTYLALTQPQSPDSRLPAEYTSYFMRCGPGGSMVKAVQKYGNQSHGRKCTTDLYSTTFKNCQRFGAFTQVEVIIHRGFRHQIRVHLATNGFPIIGDDLYNRQIPPSWTNRLYLHALALDFTHPLSGRPLHLTTAAPWDIGSLGI